MTAPVVSPLGDSALTLNFGDTIGEALSARAVAEADRIRTAGIGGVTDVVPSYTSVGVYFDPLTITSVDLRARLRSLVDDPAHLSGDMPEPRLHRIPVNYDGEDLTDVARLTGMPTEEIVRIHSAVEYRVFVIGFVPGFAYLGTLDERLALPRRDTPRKRVPSGSVAIADRQTAVYPSATPGGWHLIGTTSVPMFDPLRHEAALLNVGDRVKFEPDVR